ncbi:hypothetical protein [Synechococcus sp. MIT S1220]|uniref:hypothetical protein n=1 Tax=Synechococcus sp. MIT S1220 TaxID=3082549 RepID=UPI0039AEE5B7
MANQKQPLNDFQLTLNKDAVKQGRSFKSMLESSSAYAGDDVYWRLSGEDISQADVGGGKLQGQATLKKDGSYRHIFEIAPNNDKTKNASLQVSYFLDSKFKTELASESIEVIAKYIDPSSESGKPWAFNSARMHVKENVAVQCVIQNGEIGKNFFYKLSGQGIDKNDFDLSYARMSGKGKIAPSGSAQIPLMVRADNKTEGPEEVTVTIYKDKSYKKKLNSVSIPIHDTSIETPEQGPTKSKQPSGNQPVWSDKDDKGTWFTLSPSRTEIKENTSTRTRIDSNNKGGTVLYYKVGGKGIDKNDFDLAYARTSGEVVINSNGAAFIPHLLRNDNKTEGVEELEISLYRDKKFKKQVASTKVPILDTSTETPGTSPTKSPNSSGKQQQWGGGVLRGSWFTLSPSRSEYQRGEQVSTRIDSDSLPGEILDWKLSGPGISSNDLDQSSDGGGLTGKTEIAKNGFSLIQHVFKSDNTTNSNTEITIDLFRKNSNVKLASTTFPLIATPAEALPNKTSIEEGKSMKFKVFTRGVPEGENVYWDVTGLNITDGDFVTPRSGVTTQDFTQKFQVTFEAAKDLLTEGTELFKLNLYTDPGRTNLIGSSENISILDTSTTPQQTYNLLSSAETVQEGKGFKMKVKTKNIDPGQIVYWKGFGPAADARVAYFEDTGLTYGTASLDLEGKVILQFKTNKNSMTSSSALFNFALFETSNYITPISETASIAVLAN